ncbi:MAG: helix-turn-helix domain-containing protein [Oscillospiraceae bacterium]|nr:helix-turn-helix domain-containing protein [Oscillospiraceae bacterium]
MRTTAQIIRDLREDNDLKQSDLAKILSVSQQYYSKYEMGQYELPVRHIITLAKFYNISADYLLGLTDYSTAIKNSDFNTPTKELINDILELDDVSKNAVKDYVDLLKLREKYAHKS